MKNGDEVQRLKEKMKVLNDYCTVCEQLKQLCESQLNCNKIDKQFIESFEIILGNMRGQLSNIWIVLGEKHPFTIKNKEIFCNSFKERNSIFEVLRDRLINTE